MARWTGRPEIQHVLRAADSWRARCVERDGSILSNESLWTKANVSELKNKFLGNPIEGSDKDFYEKLQEQLAGTAPHIKKLAAEFVWFLVLFPQHGKFAQETKRAQISQVWEWSGDKLPASEFLSDDCLTGVGNPGTAYLTHRFRQFGFLLETFERWKSLTGAEQNRLLTQDVPWEFVRWIDEIPNAEKRPVRNAILYFLFPDHLERNLSNDHRRQIVDALRDSLPVELRPKGRKPSLIDCDKAIAALRKTFEKEHGTTQLDFYRPPIYALWWTGVRDKTRSEVASAIGEKLSKYGLEINQCGQKKAKLADCPPLNPKTGYWEDPSGATSKPLRWLIHFNVTKTGVAASLPGLKGDKQFAFANTAKAVSGAVTARIVPVFRLESGSYFFYEPWEWMLLFCFMPALKKGSSGQLFEEYDPQTGRLLYMGKQQTYVAAGLVGLIDEEDILSHAGLSRQVRYAEATAALAALLHVANDK